MRLFTFRLAAIGALTLWLAACSKGGQLTLEPGAIKVKTKGSPYVSVVQGAKAHLVSSGTDGVTGWATVQAISSKDISSGSHTMIVNKASAHLANQ